MINLSSRSTIILLKVYVVLALAVATVLSPLSLSFIPVLTLAWYLYSWRWPVTRAVTLITQYFVFFAIALLWDEPAGPLFSWLFSLPVLPLIGHSLKQVAESRRLTAARRPRYPTPVFITLLVLLLSVLVVSLFFGSLSLLIASLLMTGYFSILAVLVLRRLPRQLVEASALEVRLLAGTQKQMDIGLKVNTSIGGLLFLESPYEWLKVNTEVLPLTEPNLTAGVTLKPDLSGPSAVKLKCLASDRWGLVQVSFELQPIHLFVTPRARYAEWLAQKYLAATRPGDVRLEANVSAIKPIYGLRSGIEYYGSQLYQPGDSLKNIDWKHSLKHNELISKEFAEFHGQTAVILVNLAAGGAEEADKLAYNIIVTALSLAREDIPSAFSAYDQESVKATTHLLRTRQLVLRALQVARQIVTLNDPVRYLNPPDVTRLKANMSRVSQAESPASKKLLELLQLEYRSLGDHAASHPATKALNDVFARVDRQSNIVVISQRNHDAEALAFNTFTYKRRGNSVITV